MPELPEVEVVRRGLARWVVDRPIAGVDVSHPRAVRRQVGGVDAFTAALRGRTIRAAQRRGKYLVLPLDPITSPIPHGPGPQAILGHLGMSGQLLVVPPEAPDGPHLRVRFRFADEGSELRFVDQRTFGGLAVEPVGPGGVPLSIGHIARDPLDPAFDNAAFVRGIRRRRTGIKRALLDQSLVAGIGNIYADEALWLARLHWARPTETLTRPVLADLLAAVRAVMTEALAAGGTSFDALYVDVNGSSGYFERSLAAYGRVGKPCRRCGTPLVRDAFMNRSSFRCPRCQRVPRRPRW
ncbi:MAG: bifunctional DNA-formamidopyrimidine glycosylase/DNA-(apurinic or apyrimidinic site) lyase [Mycobacteriales bacterium]